MKKRFQNSNLRIKNVIFEQLPIQPNILIGEKPGELFFRTSSLPSKKISLRLPELMLEELKALANKRDIPYQSLMKMFLAERIEHELKSASR